MPHMHIHKCTIILFFKSNILLVTLLAKLYPRIYKCSTILLFYILICCIFIYLMLKKIGMFIFCVERIRKIKRMRAIRYPVLL